MKASAKHEGFDVALSFCLRDSACALHLRHSFKRFSRVFSAAGFRLANPSGLIEDDREHYAASLGQSAREFFGNASETIQKASRALQYFVKKSAEQANKGIP